MEGNNSDGGIQRLNWAVITKTLSARADFYLRTKNFKGWVSGKDVVQNLLVAFFCTDTHLGWDPSKSPLIDKEGLEVSLTVYLDHILAKRVIDLVRSYQRHPVLSIDAEKGPLLIANLQDEARSPERELQFAEWQSALIQDANGDPIIIGMIQAAPEITGSGMVDQELAEFVMGDRNATSKIINARKRFLRSQNMKKGKSKWKLMKKAPVSTGCEQSDSLMMTKKPAS